MKKTDVNKYIDNDTRNIYNDTANNTTLKKEFGLTKEIIENISKEKNEPDWVLDIRLKALEQFFKMDDPDWGPDISYLDINNIATYGTIVENAQEDVGDMLYSNYIVIRERNYPTVNG